MTRQVAVTLALVASLAGCGGCGREAPAPSPPNAGSASPGPTSSASAPAPDAPLGKYERARRAANVPALAWASFRQNRQTEGAIGEADVEHAIAATTDTPFEAASIAKPIVATAVMQLVEEGKLALDADARGLLGLPGLQRAAPFTLRQLLTHTGAIHDGPAAASRDEEPLAGFLDRYFARASAGADAGSPFLAVRPGSTREYSNVSFCLAALAVERAAGVLFHEQVRRRIFAPLGMHLTRFRPTPRGGARADAVPHRASGSGFVGLRAPVHALYPVVDVFSPPGDLARFGRAILRFGELDGARILRRDSVEEMLRVPFDAAPGDALGWQVRSFGAERVVGHEGEDEGASTGLFLDLSRNVGALVLTNGDAFQSGDEARASALNRLLEGLLDDEAR